MADIQRTAQKALETASKANPAKDGSPLSGAKGIAAGAAIAALPIAVERIAKLAKPKVSELGEQAKEKVTDAAGEIASDATDKLKPEMPKGLSAVSGLFGGSGTDGDKKGLSAVSGLFGGSGTDGDKDGDQESAGKGSAAPGYGSGRRMPIQQSVDVAAPIKDVYNLWTLFEDWPDYMHRIDSASQIDDATVAFSTKAWGITKRFEAKIMEQRPDERIEWDVDQGLSHTGVVTFHELAPRLTRVEISLDVEPDSLLEKAGRGMRFMKRAVRGDLHRFKAYAELQEEAEGGWRGTIEDGDVKRKTERKQRKSGRSRSRSSSNGRSGSSSTKAGGSKAGGSRSSSNGRRSSTSKSRSGSSSRGRSRSSSRS
jgi:uncharacterized membrane protein